MVMLAAKADGNLTAAATWALVAALTDVGANNASQGLSTAYQTSTTFTPGAIEVDGIAVYLATRSGSSGTMSVALDQGGADVPGTVVTVNVADLPNLTFANGFGGWLFFKFATPVTLAAATAYSVKAKTSVTSQVSLQRPSTATSANWSRYLRTTTAQAPAAGDMLCVTGEYTGAGTSNLRTVTMDDAAAGATVYGQVDICSKGTLQYGTAGGTNYYLKLAGNLNVHVGGTLNIGTSGTPIPSTSTTVLEFACTVNVEFGLEVREGATCNMRGATKTVKAFLAADAAALATNLTADVSTGWKLGDEIGIATTTRSNSECEKRTLSADAVGVTLSVPALTNAHDGTGSVAAELINLTRNVKVRGVSFALQGYVYVAATAVVDWQYAELYWLGSSSAGKRGVDVLTTTGSFSARFCAYHDFVTGSGAALLVTGASVNNITFSDNVTYNLTSAVMDIPQTTGTNIVIDGNWGVRTVNNTPMFTIRDVGLTFTNNRAAGSGGNGFYIVEVAVITGTFSNLNVHGGTGAGGSPGVTIQSVLGGTISNVTTWRNNSNGILFDTTRNITLDTPTAFGNLGSNLLFSNVNLRMTIKSPALRGDASFSVGSGLFINGNTYDLQVEGGSLGATVAHSVADVSFTAGVYVTANFHNTQMASPTEMSGANSLAAGSRIGSQRHDQVAGNHRSWLREGTIVIDTTIADASPSERLTPAISAEKLKSGRFRVAVLNGQTVTFTVKVRKSAAGDGTAYNGNQPRLMLEKNVAAGVAADAALATAAAAAGAWETLTGTTPAAQGNTVFTFYVDCDGTAGWVNVDTAGAS